ncbi:MAG: hypothetical protein ACTSVI_00560 [Promethearchaeota archaeon]
MAIIIASDELNIIKLIQDEKRLIPDSMGETCAHRALTRFIHEGLEKTT